MADIVYGRDSGQFRAGDDDLTLGDLHVWRMVFYINQWILLLDSYRFTTLFCLFNIPGGLIIPSVLSHISMVSTGGIRSFCHSCRQLIDDAHSNFLLTSGPQNILGKVSQICA